MTFDLVSALIGFAFVSSITPGPNNLMLLASGANYGLRRSVPHIAGVALGHSFMVAMVGLGLGRVFDAFPAAHTGLQVVSVGYLLYLAWKIATAAPPRSATAEGRPLTFLQAAAFQWVNPKAWYMAVYAVTNYTPDIGLVGGASVVAGVFFCTNLPSISVWAGMGTQLRRWLTDPARLHAFNWTMAAILVATLWPILRG